MPRSGARRNTVIASQSQSRGPPKVPIAAGLSGFVAAEKAQEGLQAIEATKRLAEILSGSEFTVLPNGKDRYGRTLARFVIGDTTAGEMLVDEGLAQPWRGRQEEWCR